MKKIELQEQIRGALAHGSDSWTITDRRERRRRTRQLAELLDVRKEVGR